MKVIDLLNKIANEELKEKPNLANLPKKIKYKDEDLGEREYSLLVSYEFERYWLVYAEDNLSEDVWGELPISSYNLNDEIEIIEE